MSSALKSFSQIPVRVKNLVAIASYSSGEGVGSAGVGAFTLTPGALLDLGSLALAGDVEDNSTTGYAARNLVAGELFKDMGRQITVLDTDDATHLAVYREVQLMAGPSTEGVDGDDTTGFRANIFVRVWAADGNGVRVARTG